MKFNGLIEYKYKYE